MFIIQYNTYIVYHSLQCEMSTPWIQEGALRDRSTCSMVSLHSGLLPCILYISYTYLCIRVSVYYMWFFLPAGWTLTLC